MEDILKFMNNLY